MQNPYRNFYGVVKYGKGCKFGAFVDIGNTVFGENCQIQSFVSIPRGWTFGDRVFIGPGVRFCNDKHPHVGKDWKSEGGVVGNDVAIGAGAIILPGVNLGEGCNIGAVRDSVNRCVCVDSVFHFSTPYLSIQRVVAKLPLCVC